MSTIIARKQTTNELIKLIISAQNGNNNDMELLIKRYEPLVRKISKKYFFPKEEMEDVFQEGRIALFQAIKDYKEEMNVPFYLFVNLVLKRKFLSAIKIKNSQKQKLYNNATSLNKIIENDPHEVSLSIVNLELDNYNNPSKIVNGKHLIKEIIKPLTKLEVDIFYCYFIYQMKPAEISEKLNITTKSIDNAISRIKKKSLKNKEQLIG